MTKTRVRKPKENRGQLRKEKNRGLTPILPPGVRSHHDMGGGLAGKVEPSEHDYEDWERRVDALMMLCSGVKGKRKLLTVDELRKNIESLTPDAYDRLAYYEKWITSLTNSLIQRGVITTGELAKKMREVEKRNG